MKVYCDRMECKNCKDGICENIFYTGEKAIKLHENCFGVLVCTDFVEEEMNFRENDGIWEVTE